VKTLTIAPELVIALKQLRLGPIVDTLPDRLVLAEKQEMPFQELLLLLLTDEIARRHGSAAARRANNAGLDPDLVIERWDKTAKVHFDRKLFQELCSLRFVEARRNVVVLGQVGVGKTFLASALGHLACRSGFNVRFLRTDTLLSKLKQSRFDNSRDALLADLCAVDLLILDDFALEPMGREESRDVYQLFVERNARTATVVTSNRDTAEWLAMFDDMLLAQSAVDRFANNAYDLIIEGESYRPRLKPNIEADGPPPAAPVTKRHTNPRKRPSPKAT
jgi:DNA replication protein DnaC